AAGSERIRAILPDPVAAADLPPLAVHVLPCARFKQPRLPPAASAQDQRAVVRERHFPGARKFEIDPVGSRARLDEQVVFDLPPGAVPDYIYARIEALIFYSGIIRNVRHPFARVIADKIMALARRWFYSENSRPGVGVHKTHAQYVRFNNSHRQSLSHPPGIEVRLRLMPFRLGAAQFQDGLARREEKSLGAATRQELYAGLRLPAIGPAEQRQVAVSLF